MLSVAVFAAAVFQAGAVMLTEADSEVALEGIVEACRCGGVGW